MKAVNRFLTNLISLPLIMLLVLLGILPFGLLYFFSELLYLLMYYVAGYRKKVVQSNLAKAFPEKSPEDRNRIARGFYRHLADVIVEVMGLLTASPSSMRRRVRLDSESMELMGRYHREKRSAILILGHYGNWEWMGAGFNLDHPGQLVAGYRLLRNKLFNWLVYRTRMRFYQLLIPSKQLARKIVSRHKEGKPAVYAFLADQWPPPETAWWITFLGRQTPFFTGPEKLAKKLGHPVLFCSIRKQKRGRYLINVQIITEDPATMPEKEITRRYAVLLETEIRRHPQYWFWSHRRWKRENKEA